MVFDGLLQDTRFALRAMWKNPGFTAVAVLTLALGIGANTAIFSVVNAVLLRPLPYPDAGRLVTLPGVLYENYVAWKGQARSFNGLAIYYRNSGRARVTLTGIADPEAAQGGFTSATFFSVLGVQPVIGRPFTAEEEAQRARVVVLSDALWRRWFAASPGVLGRTLEIDGAPFQVIGVMPETFQWPATETQFWAPITTNAYWLEPVAWDAAHSPGFYLRWDVIGRLRPGVSAASAQREIDALTARRAIATLRVEMSPNMRATLLVLAGAVMFVLLIACVNVSNLILARGAARRQEIAIRSALGAGRWRLVRLMLIEAGTLAVSAGALALLGASAALRGILAMAPANVPRLEQTSLDGRVLGFAFASTCLAAMAFGLVPAFKIAGLSRRTRRSGGPMVVLEVSLSVVLLTGAGLLIRTLFTLEAVDTGFRPQNVLNMRVLSKRVGFYADLRRQIAAIPGVQAAGGVANLFSSGERTPFGLRAVEGHLAEPAGGWRGYLAWSTVSGDFFDAMGARLLRGRFFTERDDKNTPLVAVIDESVARRYWSGEDPIGKRFKGQDARGKHDDWLTVVGVVRDMRRHGLENSPTPTIYEWSLQSGDVTSDLVVRTATKPQAMTAALRAAVRSVDRAAVIYSIAPVETELNEQIAPQRFQARLLGFFAGLALMLAAVGIYGVMHYSVAQRRREIGIRMATGARPSDVLRLVLRQGLTLAGAGLASGILAALWITRLVSRLLYGVSPTDPVTFVAASMVLAAVALLATLIPGWRAARVDPLVALRQE
ncbi:MAG TPA: ABC transporter permease [Bryobacteraceae bacterium]|nr:ABC transporter permease [Bryobacteraceae bacterium]